MNADGTDATTLVSGGHATGVLGISWQPLPTGSPVRSPPLAVPCSEFHSLRSPGRRTALSSPAVERDDQTGGTVRRAERNEADGEEHNPRHLKGHSGGSSRHSGLLEEAARRSMRTWLRTNGYSPERSSLHGLIDQFLDAWDELVDRLAEQYELAVETLEGLPGGSVTAIAEELRVSRQRLRRLTDRDSSTVRACREGPGPLELALARQLEIGTPWRRGFRVRIHPEPLRPCRR